MSCQVLRVLRPQRLVAALVPWLLAACAQLPTTTNTPPAGPQLSGRLQLRTEAGASTPASSWSAAFELQGDEHHGRLSLLSPLGTLMARADWQPEGASLSTPNGQRQFDSLDGLAREALGEDLPLAALTHWLAGRPWPGAPSTPQSQGFEQLGWQIDLSRYADDGALLARRELPPPALTVRARLDR